MTVGGEQFSPPVSWRNRGAEFVAYVRLRRMIQAPAAMRASGQA